MVKKSKKSNNDDGFAELIEEYHDVPDDEAPSQKTPEADKA